MKIAGKEANLLLATAAPTSTITEQIVLLVVDRSLVKEKFATELRIGFATVPATFAVRSEDSIRSIYGKGVDGVLGRDILVNLAMGINLEGDNLTIWPASQFSDKAAETWFLHSPQWPGSAATKLVSVPLVGDVLTGYTLPVVVGKNSVDVLFDTSLGATFLPDSQLASDFESWPLEGSLRFVREATVSGRHVPWFPFATQVKAKDDQSHFVRSGKIGLKGLMSRMVIVDLARNRLMLEDGDADYFVSRALTSILGVPVYIDKAALWVGPLPRSASQVMQLQRYNSLQVSEVNHKRVDRWLPGLRNRDTHSYRTIQSLCRTKGKFELTIGTGVFIESMFVDSGK